MGIISPEKRTVLSKTLLTCLIIILSPILMVAVLLYLLWGAILYLAIWLTSKKNVVVFVYSNSPTWKDYIETEILPYIQARAVILNWSERRNWGPSLPVLALRYFGGYRNFNPIALIFRPFRFVRTFRFYKAFQRFKHGDPGEVEKIRRDLFEALEI